MLGKSVIDARGKEIGVVDRIFINPSDIATIGISVDKGILENGLVIGTGYIEKITDHGVLLKIKPAPDLKGMQVFDLTGKYVGKVQRIETYGTENRVRGITVRVSLFRAIKIPYPQIKKIGHNILLNCAKQDLFQKS